MTCSFYIPSCVDSKPKTYPYLVYLSGLTCTDENVCQKAAPFGHLFKNKVCTGMKCW